MRKPRQGAWWTPYCGRPLALIVKSKSRQQHRSTGDEANEQRSIQKVVLSYPSLQIIVTYTCAQIQF
jgi:hypothetical protein